MRRFLSAIASMLMIGAVVAAQDRYETRKEHDPNGTGKFYMGREIAHVMSYQGANWLERPEREKEEQVSKLMPALNVKPGEVVADFGAGSGFHTMKLSALVGPTGKVYAVDIQPEMLDIIRKRVKREKVTNVELILARPEPATPPNPKEEVKNKEKNPTLPANAIDMILMVDVYHELSHPYEVTVELVKALKPGGRLVFVEFRLEDPKVPILAVHRMTEKQVKKEMEPFALKHAKTHGHLPWQHVIVFEKVVEEKAPPKKP